LFFLYRQEQPYDLHERDHAKEHRKIEFQSDNRFYQKYKTGLNYVIYKSCSRNSAGLEAAKNTKIRQVIDANIISNAHNY
jgi:hypothetical protein